MDKVYLSIFTIYFYILKNYIIKTTKFTATLGVNAGYGHNNEMTSAKDIVAEVRQKSAKEVFDILGIYISANVQDANTVYHQDWGCPEGGEKTAVITGVRNPEFVKDVEQRKKAVIDVLSLCQKELYQTTTQVEFTDDVDFVYLKREEEHTEEDEE